MRRHHRFGIWVMAAPVAVLCLAYYPIIRPQLARLALYYMTENIPRSRLYLDADGNQWYACGVLNVRRFDLSNTSLRGFDLKAVNLIECDLRGTDLRGTNLFTARFDGCLFDWRTRWPEGFDPHSCGAVQVED